MQYSTPIDELRFTPEALTPVCSYVMSHPGMRDIQRLLIEFCDIPEMKALALTSRSLSKLVNEDFFWQVIGRTLEYELLNKSDVQKFFLALKAKIETSPEANLFGNNLTAAFRQIVYNEEIHSKNSTYKKIKSKDSLLFWNAFAVDLQLENCDLSQMDSFNSIIETEEKLADSYKVNRKLFSKVSMLNLFRFDLNYLPSQIDYFKNLKELNLSSNKLTHFPKVFSQLTKIESLDLSRNKFKTEPQEIYKLIELKELNLSANMLTGLTTGIRNLTKLHWFDLSHNKLNELPMEISALTNLETFNLAGNQLAIIPSVIGLTRLHWLYLSKNHFRVLPEVENLTGLKYLDISYNEFNEIPPLQTLHDLKGLDISYNPTNSLFEGIQALSRLDRIDLNRAQFLGIQSKLNSFNRQVDVYFSDNFIVGAEMWRLNFS